MEAKNIIATIAILAVLAWGVVGGMMIWRALHKQKGTAPPASEESAHLQFMNSGVTEKLRITSKGDVFLEGEYVGSLVSDTPASEEG